MTQRLNVSLNNKVSFALCMIDDYSAERKSDANIVVTLEQLPYLKPVRKQDGYFVFTGLDSPDKNYTYKVAVRSPFYLTETFEVTPGMLDAAYPVVNVKLKPRANYPFDRGATLIRGTLSGTGGEPLAGVPVRAELLTPDYFVARLRPEGLAAGEAAVSFTNVVSRITVGDIVNISEGEKSEYCEIAAVIDDWYNFRLKEPLKYDHGRDASILPVIATRSDERGELAVYFRNFITREFDVRLDFLHEGISTSREIRMKTGEVFNLGKLAL